MDIMVGVAIIVLMSGSVNAITFTVDDNGGANYSRIQDAINAARSRDTIIVYSGTYYENVIVNKQIELRGQDNGRGMPVVNAMGAGNPITIKANGVILDGFNAINGVSYGIAVNSGNNVIRNNNASKNKNGIYLSSISSNNTLSGNIVNSNLNSGINLALSSKNNLTNNTVNSNIYGIVFTSSNNTTLISNNVNMNNFGIIIISSNSNTLTNNIVNSNLNSGINLAFSSNSNLTNNTANSNVYGILLKSSNNIKLIGNNAGLNNYGTNIISSVNNILINNIADSNKYFGIYFESSSYNTLINNTVRSNGIGIQLNSSNNNTMLKNTAGMNNVGINVVSSFNNSLTDNIADSNINYGIILKSSINMKLIGNNASMNNVGINVVSSSHNSLIENIVDSNTNQGINLNSSNNNTILKNNASMNNYGINVVSSFNNSLTENIAYSNNNGIYLESSCNNSINSNTANSNLTGFVIINSSNWNTFSNNIIITSNESVASIYLDSSYSNHIKGGSIKSINSLDYFLNNAGDTNEFISTDFTDLRTIFFKDSNSYFNYNNNAMDKIWLRTNISTISYLNRNISSWNENLIQWNDTGNMIANYTLTGLKKSTIYDVYNKSHGIETNSYTLKTDSNGNLPSFMIALYGNMEIKILNTNNSLVISDIEIANITLNSTEISWQTNEPSDSLIKYGRYSQTYSYEQYNSNLVKNHSITLSNLLLATTYFFVLNSTNQAGKSRESQELSVQTISPFSNHSVAMIYERVSDKMQNEIGRNISNVIDLLNSTKTDIIFRGWWDEGFMVENCTQFQTPEKKELCEKSSGSYAHLKNATTVIKDVSPNITIIGAVPAHQIYKTIYNPMTEQLIKYPESWNMSFDPAKFGIMDISKEQFQCNYAKNRSWLNETFDCTQYNPANMNAFFPDITNDNYHELLLSLAKKQIDSGEDAIWFDGLFLQANYIAEITNNTNHSGVNASFFASSNIIDEIHDYKQGVYAGTWVLQTFPYPSPNLDFVTLSPIKEEIMNQSFMENSWNVSIKSVKDTRGDIPIIAFIDWSDTSNTPLGAFSQNLSIENQNNFLKVADAFFQKKGLIFAYPLHGGYLGNDANIIAYGQYKYYDALAPEFDTFETIKQLSLKKIGS